MRTDVTSSSSRRTGQKTVKCVVWDLDQTLWEGVLLEDAQVALRPGVVEVVRTLDDRGILQSVASRNDEARALAVLRALGLDEYFLAPQINWNAKSASIAAIARRLNIGLDTVAFVDDQPFEREEVRYAHPEVRCFDAAEIGRLVDLPDLHPRFVTDESRTRRLMYLADQARQQAEEGFGGPGEAFLATLNMVFTIAPAGEGDLQRAEELTVRTNQLNSTGRTYSFEDLDRLRTSPSHDLLVAGLEDRFGGYGKIGLALVEREPAVWTIRLLLMSCRVMSRGVGSLLLNHIIGRAVAAGVALRAEFIPTDVNRMMFVTYRFAGFREAGNDGHVILLERPPLPPAPGPSYVDVRVDRPA